MFARLAPGDCAPLHPLDDLPDFPSSEFANAALLGYRYHGARAVLAVALMLLASPAFWFIDKVHTELLTVCLIVSSIILLLAQRYLLSALLIAVAATQNPSFALVACIPLFYRVVLQREQRYSFVDLSLGVLTALTILVHPAYYFFRYGVITPTLLAGGTAMGNNLSTFYVWIIDPDLGLLPNWPLGAAVALVLLGAWAGRRYPRREAGAPMRWPAFVILFLAINFYAHSSTLNLNSGATPGLARYALWYLPLAFPLFLQAFALFPKGTKRRYAGLAALVLFCAASVAVNDPRAPERNDEGTVLSRLIQQHAPWMYNPPHEVFVERYSGVGENVHGLNLRAVVGPDCGKMVVFPGPGRANALAPPACMWDQAKLNAWVNADAAVRAIAAAALAPAYSRLPASAGETLRRVVPHGAQRVGTAGDGGAILGSGWSGREEWGVWSDRTDAFLLLPCGPGGTPLDVSLKLRPFRSQAITITSGERVLWKGEVAGTDQDVRFALTPDACIDEHYTVRLSIPGAVSPEQLGMSRDGRKLGVGLSAYDIQPRSALTTGAAGKPPA